MKKQNENISVENERQIKIMHKNFKLLRKLKGFSIEELSKLSKIDKNILIIN